MFKSQQFNIFFQNFSLGDWILFLAMYWRSNDEDKTDSGNPIAETDPENMAWNDKFMAFMEVRFANFIYVLIPAVLVSYAFFFGMGFYWHVSKTI